MIDDMTKVYIWPDGDWCYEDELQEYSWKSDDYKVYFLQLSNDSDIENVILSLISA